MLDHPSFGAWLKRRRKALDLTQAALARLASCSRPPQSLLDFVVAAQSASDPHAARPSGTVTFLFSDIEGSTARWEHAPAQMSVAFHCHETLLRQAIADHGGYAYKGEA